MAAAAAVVGRWLLPASAPPLLLAKGPKNEVAEAAAPQVGAGAPLPLPALSMGEKEEPVKEKSRRGAAAPAPAPGPAAAAEAPSADAEKGSRERLWKILSRGRSASL